MTRDEAIKIVYPMWGQSSNLAINIFEKLGMIEIESEKSLEDIIIEDIVGKYIGLTYELKRRGYKIIKDEK